MSRRFDDIKMFCQKASNDSLKITQDDSEERLLCFAAEDASERVTIVLDRDQVAELATRMMKWLGSTSGKWVDL